MSTLQQLIIENQERIQWQKVIKRELVFDYQVFDLQKIVSIVWPRRAGKTYFMYQMIQHLIQSGTIEKEQVVFIDFSEYRWSEFDFEKLLGAYFEVCPSLSPWFFFDEIQEIREFRTGVLSLFNRGYKIIMSGSNSNLLSRELSTHFGWRSLETYVYPLSWGEFLDFRGFIRYPHMTLAQKGYEKNLFGAYLRYGGYPEVVIANTPWLKETLLSSYFEIIVYRDLKERYKIENDVVLRYLLRRVIISNTKDFNTNKIYHDLKSQGIEVSKNTLYLYLEYARNIFFINILKNFYALKGASKIFLITWGFQILPKGWEDLGQSFENVLYMDLLRRYGSVFFLRGKEGEIDLYLPDEDISIQACYHITRENLARELDPLLSASWRIYCVYYEIDDDVVIDEKYERVERIAYLDEENMKNLLTLV